MFVCATFLNTTCMFAVGVFVVQVMEQKFVKTPDF